jgi:hypothetical protein
MPANSSQWSPADDDVQRVAYLRQLHDHHVRMRAVPAFFVLFAQ